MALLLAGGQGSRLGILTKNTAKPGPTKMKYYGRKSENFIKYIINLATLLCYRIELHTTMESMEPEDVTGE